jgi:hypothetical protein
MPEIFVSCPQCERPLRVPDALLGRPAKCPACGLTFAVPAGGHEAPLMPVPATPSAEYDTTEQYNRPGRPPAPWQFDQEVREGANRLVTPPAVCLLITGILGILGVLANCLHAVLVLAGGGKPPGADVPDFIRKAMEMVTPETVLIESVVFGSVSLVIILGAIQMLRRRMYGLAIASSILAMINIECLCCVLGLPVGIWSLVVLLKPEVRSVFQ